MTTQVENWRTWIRNSRTMEKKHPERYLSYYVGRVVCDEQTAVMSAKTLDELKENCGYYDGTLPTGQYCGKIFLRGTCMVWFGIDPKHPTTHIRLNSRQIVVV